MEDKLTCVESNKPNRFYTCKLSEWLPRHKSRYQEYNFFKEKFNINSEIKFIKEREIIYLILSEYEYKGILFNIVVDLDYEFTEFIVKDESKVDIIRMLVEDTIRKI